MRVRNVVDFTHAVLQNIASHKHARACEIMSPSLCHGIAKAWNGGRVGMNKKQVSLLIITSSLPFNRYEEEALVNLTINKPEIDQITILSSHSD